MDQIEAYFDSSVADGVERLVPRSCAASGWSRDTMRGPAVCAALARAAEHVQAQSGRTDLRPARITVDLFAPSPLTTFEVVSDVVRESRGLLVVVSSIVSGGVSTARSSTLMVRPTTSPSGRTWSREQAWPVPPPGRRSSPLFRSEGRAWTPDRAAHQNADRTFVWQPLEPIVEGESTSPFVAAAGAADLANLTVNWSDQGMAHINADVSVSLARLPRGPGIGLAALDRLECEGISTGTAALYDLEGTFGVAAVNAVGKMLLCVSLPKTRVRSCASGSPCARSACA